MWLLLPRFDSRSAASLGVQSLWERGPMGRALNWAQLSPTVYQQYLCILWDLIEGERAAPHHFTRSLLRVSGQTTALSLTALCNLTSGKLRKWAHFPFFAPRRFSGSLWRQKGMTIIPHKMGLTNIISLLLYSLVADKQLHKKMGVHSFIEQIFISSEVPVTFKRMDSGARLCSNPISGLYCLWDWSMSLFPYL